LPPTQPTFNKTYHDNNADIATNVEVINSDFLAPIVLPKSPVNIAPMSGKKTIDEYSMTINPSSR
jgi:predicted ABC-type ATPase